MNDYKNKSLNYLLAQYQFRLQIKKLMKKLRNL